MSKVQLAQSLLPESMHQFVKEESPYPSEANIRLIADRVGGFASFLGSRSLLMVTGPLQAPEVVAHLLQGTVRAGNINEEDADRLGALRLDMQAKTRRTASIQLVDAGAHRLLPRELQAVQLEHMIGIASRKDDPWRLRIIPEGKEPAGIPENNFSIVHLRNAGISAYVEQFEAAQDQGGAVIMETPGTDTYIPPGTGESKQWLGYFDTLGAVALDQAATLAHLKAELAHL